MQTFIRKSLKLKIVLAILLPLALVEGFLFFLYLDHINAEFSVRYKNAASTISSPFITSIEKKLETLASLEDKQGFLEIYVDLKGGIEFPRWLDEYEEVTAVAFVDAAGQQLAATPGGEGLAEVEFADDLSRVSSARSDAFIAVAIPLQTDNNPIGRLLFRFSDKQLVAEKQAALLLCAFVLTLSLFFSSILAWLISLAIIRPINSLALDSERLAAGDLDRELCALTAIDEIGLLARNFRLMRDAIRENRNKLEERNYQLSQEVTERKRAEEALERRNIALTRPLEDASNISFADLFNMDDIQRLQNEFATATGVASIITSPDGTPITAPSNWCRLCRDIIRKTEKGCSNCYKSDAKLGKLSHDGPLIQLCVSGGLWDAGAGITVGGRHIANWLIGQVRDETQTDEKIRAYAAEIGADEAEAVEAFWEVPAMSREQFVKVSQALFTLAGQLSNTAYQNVQQARFITERKQGEDELRRLRNYLSNIIDSMPSVLIGVDTNGRVTQWNSEAARATGTTSREVLGQPLALAFPRLSNDMARVQEAIKARQKQVHPKRSYQQDGQTRYEDVIVYPLTANGSEGAVIRVDDVTERVRIEEMMVQSEKMLSVGGLAAGMAHEINNPLAGMIQSATVLRNRITGDLPANDRAAAEAGATMTAIRSFHEARGVARLLDQICESGARAATIVSNMLTFARKETGARSSHNLAELLDRSIDLARSDYDLQKKEDFRDIEIVREYEEGLPLVVCEVGTFQQVILNLLRNASEAMHEEKAEDKTPRIVLRLAYDKSSGRVQIEIEDNGPGMDEETCKRIFEPFFTTKDVGSGTGLGLSVSYFIITESHAGEMSVESQPEQGTKFTVRLPVEGTPA